MTEFSTSIEPSSAVVLSSVLFLVVIELSRNFEQEDFKTKAINPEYQGNVSALGPLSIIHFLNFAILSLGSFVTINSGLEHGELSLLLIFLLYIGMLLLLPFLEIDDYERHTKIHGWDDSFVQHSKFAFISIASIVGISLVSMIEPPYVAFGLFVLGFIGIIYGVIYGPQKYLSIVRDEYQKQAKEEFKEQLDNFQDPFKNL